MRPAMTAALCFALSASSTACSAGSEFSITSRRAAPKVTMRSQISEPIEPPPPVTTTALPLMKSSSRPVVDSDARPQQQVLDRDRSELHGRAAGIERRHLAHRQTQLARANEDRFRPRFRRQRRRRQHQPRHLRAATGEIGDHAFEIVDVAQHRNAADRLAAVGGGRRQHADRPDFLHRAAFDRRAAALRRRPRGRAPASASRRRRGRAAACARSGNSGRRRASRRGRTSARASTAGW